jgi:hypothetical protein
MDPSFQIDETRCEYLDNQYFLGHIELLRLRRFSLSVKGLLQYSDQINNNQS